MIHILPQRCFFFFFFKLNAFLSLSLSLPVKEQSLAASIISGFTNFYCVFPFSSYTIIYNLYSEKCFCKQLTDDPYVRPPFKSKAFKKMYILYLNQTYSKHLSYLY